MGTSLTGVKIKDSYDSLLKVTDNGPLDGSLQVITDGLGNNSALSLSTSGASVGGTLAVSGNATFDTDTLFVDATKESIGIGIAPFENSLTTSMDFEGGGGIFAYGNGVYFNGNLYYDGGWKLKATGSASNYLVDGNHIFYTTASGTAGDTVTTVQRVKIYNEGDVSFRDSSNNEAFYWDASAASLGIGTASPTAIAGFTGLTIDNPNSGSILDLKKSGAEALRLLVLSTSDQRITGSGTLSLYAGTSSDMVFNTNSAERMRIDSSGSVIIKEKAGAVTIPSNGLSLSTGYGVSYLNSKSTGGTYVDMYYGAANQIFSTSDTERMRITSGGALLVGKDSLSGGTAGFEVEPSGIARITRSSDSPLFLNRLTTEGTIVDIRYNSSPVGSISVTASATAYNTSSDYRLKEDWVAMEGALDRVDALKPINFAWKSSGERVDGFLAHELAEVVPEAVTGEKDATEIRSVEVSPAVYEDVIHPAEEAILDEEGNVIEEAKEEWVEKVIVSEAVFEDQEFPVYQGIDQSKIVPLLVAAIQELRAELNALKQA